MSGILKQIIIMDHAKYGQKSRQQQIQPLGSPRLLKTQPLIIQTSQPMPTRTTHNFPVYAQTASNIRRMIEEDLDLITGWNDDEHVDLFSLGTDNGARQSHHQKSVKVASQARSITPVLASRKSPPPPQGTRSCMHQTQSKMQTMQKKYGPKKGNQSIPKEISITIQSSCPSCGHCATHRMVTSQKAAPKSRSQSPNVVKSPKLDQQVTKSTTADKIQMVQKNFKQAATKKSPTRALTERKLSGSVGPQSSFLSVAAKSKKKIATIIAIREGSIEPIKEELKTPEKAKLPTSLISNIQQKYQNKSNISPTSRHSIKKIENKFSEEKSQSINRDFSPRSSKSLYKAVVGGNPKQKRLATPVCTFYAPSVASSTQSLIQKANSPKAKIHQKRSPTSRIQDQASNISLSNYHAKRSVHDRSPKNYDSTSQKSKKPEIPKSPSHAQTKKGVKKDHTIFSSSGRNGTLVDEQNQFSNGSKEAASSQDINNISDKIQNLSSASLQRFVEQARQYEVSRSNTTGLNRETNFYNMPVNNLAQEEQKFIVQKETTLPFPQYQLPKQVVFDENLTKQAVQSRLEITQQLVMRIVDSWGMNYETPQDEFVSDLPMMPQLVDGQLSLNTSSHHHQQQQELPPAVAEAEEPQPQLNSPEDRTTGQLSEQNSPSVHLNVQNEFEWGKGTFDERDEAERGKRASSMKGSQHANEVASSHIRFRSSFAEEQISMQDRQLYESPMNQDDKCYACIVSKAPVSTFAPEPPEKIEDLNMIEGLEFPLCQTIENKEDSRASGLAELNQLLESVDPPENLASLYFNPPRVMDQPTTNALVNYLNPSNESIQVQFSALGGGASGKSQHYDSRLNLKKDQLIDESLDLVFQCERDAPTMRHLPQILEDNPFRSAASSGNVSLNNKNRREESHSTPKLKESIAYRPEKADSQRPPQIESYGRHMQILQEQAKNRVISPPNMQQVEPRKDVSPLRNNGTGFISRIKSFLVASVNHQPISSPTKSPSRDKVLKLYRCKCPDSDKSFACSSALKWLEDSSLRNFTEHFDHKKCMNLYHGLARNQELSGCESQIMRDVPRTYPASDPFMSKPDGQQPLFRVLNNFAKYDRSVGYVQGMNFIAAALLHHCSEEVAFWLFVSLIEDYEMRDIYQNGTPGVYKHTQLLQLLQMEHLGDLFQHLCLNGIQVEMYASDWLFTLFSNIIPMSQYHLFLGCFISEGWNFFYKFSLAYLEAYRQDLLRCYDIQELLDMIKLKKFKRQPSPPNEGTGTSSDFTGNDSSDLDSTSSPAQLDILLKSLITRRGGSSLCAASFAQASAWPTLIGLCHRDWSGRVNEAFIQELLARFDPQQLQFRVSQNSSRNESLRDKLVGARLKPQI